MGVCGTIVGVVSWAFVHYMRSIQEGRISHPNSLQILTAFGYASDFIYLFIAVMFFCHIGDWEILLFKYFRVFYVASCYKYYWSVTTDLDMVDLVKYHIEVALVRALRPLGIFFLGESSLPLCIRIILIRRYREQADIHDAST